LMASGWMTYAFFSRFLTVSDGCAPTVSHFLMAGAFRLVSFFRGSAQQQQQQQ
jgi:hypothetical protein